MQDAGPLDAGPPDAGFLPTHLGTRLVLWLDADRGFDAGASGAIWNDLSPAQNHATQSDSARLPTWAAAGSAMGLPAHALVRFDATQFLTIADHPSLQWSSGDFALYAVLLYTNPLAEWTIVYAKWTDTGPDFPGLMFFANYPNTPATPTPFTGFVARVDTDRIASAVGPYNDGALRVVAVRRSANTLELRLNGTADAGPTNIAGFNTTGFDAVGRPVYLGGRPEGTQQFHGGIAEVIGIKGSLSSSEQQQLEGYLRAKFGL